MASSKNSGTKCPSTVAALFRAMFRSVSRVAASGASAWPRMNCDASATVNSRGPSYAPLELSVPPVVIGTRSRSSANVYTSPERCSIVHMTGSALRLTVPGMRHTRAASFTSSIE